METLHRQLDSPWHAVRVQRPNEDSNNYMDNFPHNGYDVLFLSIIVASEKILQLSSYYKDDLKIREIA